MRIQAPLLSLVIAIFSSLFTLKHATAAPEEVKIGFAAPLMGAQAMYGKDVQNGVIMAVEDFNASKPVIAGKEVKLVLLSEDDQADAHLGRQVAQKLVDRGIKGMLGPMNSNVAIPASRIYHEAGIPQISAATAPEYTQQGFNTTFRMLPSDLQQGTVMGNFAVYKLGFKKIAIIDDRTAYGQGLAQAFENAARTAGAQIVRHEFTFDKAHNFKSMLIGLKRLKPEAIYYAGNAVQAVPLAQQMHELGIKATLLGADMLKIDKFNKAAGVAAEGAVASLAGKPLVQMPGGEAFNQRHKKRFGVLSGAYAPYAYDSAMAMFTAMKKADSVEPAKYLPYLANTDMDSVTKKNLTYSATGDLLNGSTTVYKVVNGDWQVLDVIHSSIIQ